MCLKVACCGRERRYMTKEEIVFECRLVKEVM